MFEPIRSYLRISDVRLLQVKEYKLGIHTTVMRSEIPKELRKTQSSFIWIVKTAENCTLRLAP